jgi:hypothetical protein
MLLINIINYVSEKTTKKADKRRISRQKALWLLQRQLSPEKHETNINLNDCVSTL